MIKSSLPRERQRIIHGLSTDIKPLGEQIEAMTIFIEQDTGNSFIYTGGEPENGGKWVQTKAAGLSVLGEIWDLDDTRVYYGNTQILPVTSGTSLFLGLTTGSGRTQFNTINLQSEAGETRITIEEGATFTGGTGVAVTDTNWVDNEPFTGELFESVTKTLAGTVKYDASLLSGNNSNNQVAQGSRGSNIELQPNQSYVMEIANLATGTRDMQLEFSFLTGSILA